MSLPAGMTRLGAVTLVLGIVLSMPLPVVAGAAAGAAATATAADDELTLRTPHPAPGALVPAGEIAIRATAHGAAAVVAAVVVVDGGPPQPVAIGAAEEHGTGGSGSERRVSLSTTVTLPAGLHTIRLEVAGDDGHTTTRTWSFTATDRAVERLAGIGRAETGVAISRAAFPGTGSARGAVLARADDFADALAGAPLAATVGGPLLLAGGTGLSTPTGRELQRVLPPGATVHLLGGEAALGAGVARDVAALGFAPIRLAGRDRFETAGRIADVLPAAGGAVLASGTSFPDALAASAPAARDGLPILLTTRDGMPPTTAAALRRRDVRTLTIVGGPAVVGEAVAQRAADLVPAVTRVAGGDRYATAAAVLEAFYDAPTGVSLASGTAFPDALAGSAHAAATGQPLLLAARSGLPRSTEAALRHHRPNRLSVYGGTSAIDDPTARAALLGAEAGTAAPRLLAATPGAAAAVPYLDDVSVLFDRPVDPARSSLYVEIDGIEIPGVLATGAPADVITLRLAGADDLVVPDVAHAGRIVAAGVREDGTVAHAEAPFTFLRPDPLFASTGGIPLHLPSRDVELIGFHEATHPGSQQLTVNTTATSMLTLGSRRRGTGSRSAADIVASPVLPVVAPVSGQVLRASTYVLYCRYTDEFLVIAPDERPGWEVKLLHVVGLQVAPGDRVEAGQTIVAASPRTLPFASQVDERSQARNWPHVHLEVVDPSVPTRPGGGC